jgi:hypothetical protein
MLAGQSGIAMITTGIGVVVVRLAAVTSLPAVVRVPARTAPHAARGLRKPARIRLEADRISTGAEEAVIPEAKAIGTSLRPPHWSKLIAPWFRMIAEWNRSPAKSK